MRHLQPEMGAAEPWWLELELFGFEDDDDDDDLDDEDDDTDEEDEDEEDEDSDDDEDEEDSDEEEDEDDEDEKSKKPKSKNIAGLKKALRRERMGRKRAEREARRAKAQLREARAGQKSKKAGSGDTSKNKNRNNGSKDDDNEEQEVQETGPSERETRLAAKLRDAAIDQVILEVATKAKFLDPGDAVKLISRKDIEFDQDEDDPTEIEIDRESVEDAVKELARKKKHLINRGGSGQGKTGSRVGSRKGRGELNDDALRKKFGLGARRD